jgi:pyruvate-ferredoxin/flavodoxin oxidoreductase
MATRQTGFCMLAESSVHEVMDLSAVAHLASIEGKLTICKLFLTASGTSHGIAKN